MKNLSILLAAFSIGATPLPPKGAVLSTSIEQNVTSFKKNGSEAVAQVRKAYEQGEYTSFLKEMDDAYLAAKERGELEQIANMRTGFSEDWQEWELRAQKLQQEQNKELIKVVQEQKTPFAEKIRSAVKEISTETEQKAISHISSFRQMAPGMGKSADENRLIEIDLEYEFKFLELNVPGASSFEKKEKRCALQMEKFSRIVAAAKTFQDSSLKKEVEQLKEHFDMRLAQKWDVADLYALANGRTAPANATEEKIASILTLYQEKLGDLTKHFVAEQDKK